MQQRPTAKRQKARTYEATSETTDRKRHFKYFLSNSFFISLYQIKGMKEEISQLKQQVTVLSESKATN